MKFFSGTMKKNGQLWNMSLIVLPAYRTLAFLHYSNTFISALLELSQISHSFPIAVRPLVKGFTNISRRNKKFFPILV